MAEILEGVRVAHILNPIDLVTWNSLASFVVIS
mgnify:CR=1 FL=1